MTGDYEPEIGVEDRTLRASRGTTITLSGFYKRKVPEMDVLARQVAQRFGIKASNWQVELEDTTKTLASAERRKGIGAFDVVQMEGTRIAFDGPGGPTVSADSDNGYASRNAEGSVAMGVSPGFWHDGRFYTSTPWKPARSPLRNGASRTLPG